MEAPQRRFDGEGVRVCNDIRAFGKAQEDAHRPCPRAECGADPHCRTFRVVAPKFHLPDMVVGVVRLAETGIRRKGEVKRVTGTERPVAHSPIVRADGRVVKQV